jgi:apolipoprotein N-acyltransferase
MNTILPNGSQANAVPEIRRTKPGLSLALLLAGTLLVGFSMGRWLAPLAAWIGPALIIRYSRDHKGWRGYPLVLAASILTMFIGFRDIWVGGMPLPLVPILGVAYGLLWSLPYLADRLMSARLRGFSSTFVYPLAATALEFVNIHFNPMGTWGATGFTQYGNLPLMQLASVTGMIGITFLMGWFAAIANWAWENRSRGSEVLRGLAAFGVVLAAVFIFGFLRLNQAPSGETVRVAGITAESLNSLNKVFSEMSDPATAQPKIQSHNEVFFRETVREAQAGAKVIIWSELSGIAFGSDEASLIARAQEVARQNGIYLVIPLFHSYPGTDQPYENKLLLIAPTGAIAMEHLKYGGALMEGNRKTGDGKLKTVTTPFGVLSAVICYDLDYPAVIQQTGRNGTGLLLVPSKDWLAIDPIHSQMAVFRAIENGMSLVRQTDAGLSLAADPYGRVLAQVSFFGSTDHSMVAQVPVRHVATIYTAFGRWFEWLCLAGFLVVVARAIIARRKMN